MTAEHTTAAGPVDLDQAQALCAAAPERLKRLRLIEQWAREDADSYPDEQEGEHVEVVAALRAGADALDMLPRLVAGLRAAREIVGVVRLSHPRSEGTACELCRLVAAYDHAIQGGGGS